MFKLLQSAADSAGYQLGYRIGQWIPFVVLGIALTVMILMLRKKNKGKDMP
jgi:hypothetical protein